VDQPFSEQNNRQGYERARSRGRPKRSVHSSLQGLNVEEGEHRGFSIHFLPLGRFCHPSFVSRVPFTACPVAPIVCATTNEPHCRIPVLSNSTAATRPILLRQEQKQNFFAELVCPLVQAFGKICQYRKYQIFISFGEGSCFKAPPFLVGVDQGTHPLSQLGKQGLLNHSQTNTLY
jgi:hypothetical protein